MDVSARKKREICFLVEPDVGVESSIRKVRMFERSNVGAVNVLRYVTGIVIVVDSKRKTTMDE